MVVGRNGSDNRWDFDGRKLHLMLLREEGYKLSYDVWDAYNSGQHLSSVRVTHLQVRVEQAVERWTDAVRDHLKVEN